MSSRYVLYTGDCEWDALYVDGKLDQLGDRYLIRDRLIELLDVEVHDTEAYFLGREARYENAAQTLEEVRTYEARQRRPLDAAPTAEELRAEARRLLAQAAELEA